MFSMNLSCPANGAAHFHPYSFDLQVQWQFQTRYRRHNRYNLPIPYNICHIGKTYHALWPCANLNIEYHAANCLLHLSQSK